MSGTVVDGLYLNNRALVDFLDAAGEVSLRTNADDSFRKILLLAAASYFEHRIRDFLLEFVTERSNADDAIVSLVRTKAIDRQYHTYFDWEKKNANKFYSLFGIRFTEHMKQLISSDTDLRLGVEAFLEIGNLRNQLVHQNYGSFSLDKTVEELYALFQSANVFVEQLPVRLRDL